jgi:flagellar biosynthetic protein FliR
VDLFGLPDFFAPGVAAAFVLTALRVGGLLLIAPAWSAKSVPMKLRTALLVVFATLLLPSATATAQLDSIAITPASFLGETAIGFALGLAAAFIVAAAEFAGEIINTSIGLSGAAIFDPINNTQGAVLSSLMQLLSLTILLIGGGHVLMLEAVAQSFVSMPLGAPLALTNGLLALVRLMTTLFALAMQFASPVIAAVLITNLALAVLGRAAPQLNVIGLAFPLQIGVGLLTLAGSIGLMVHAMNDWTPRYATSVEIFARAVQVAPTPAMRR